MNSVRYFVISGTVFVFLYRIPSFKLVRQEGWTGAPAGAQIRGEIIRSLYSCIVFALSAVTIYIFKVAGLSRMYMDLGEHSLWYAALSLLLMLVGFDAWFYMTHFSLHYFGVRRTTHDRHHYSNPPTPWAALSFSWIEVTGLSFFLVFITLVIPLNPLVYMTFMWILFLQSAVHHSSTEVYPARWMQWPGVNLVTTVRHHHLHHRSGRHNFGLYFTWCDRLFGTEHPSYRSA